MYQVIKEDIATIFSTKDVKEWYRVVGPDGMLESAYLNEEDAYGVCKKLNLQPRVSQEEIDEIRYNVEQRRIAKLIT